MNIYRHIPDIKTLEREYSPSSRVASVAEFIDAYAARSQMATQHCADLLVVQYGASVTESIDIFPAPSIRRTRKPRPVLAYIHGGYWQELSKEDHSFLAPAVNSQDFTYIAIGYGLAPAATLDEIVARCRRAIMWIVENCERFSIDATAIHLAGSSAGAQLAAMVGFTNWDLLGLSSSPICSLTLLSGIFDLRPLVPTYINTALRLSAEAALINSPALRIDAHQGVFPRTLVVFGENETAEFKRQSIEFAELLSIKGYLAEVHEIGGRNHFDLPFDLADKSTLLGALSIQHFAGAVDKEH